MLTLDSIPRKIEYETIGDYNHELETVFLRRVIVKYNGGILGGFVGLLQHLSSIGVKLLIIKDIPEYHDLHSWYITFKFKEIPKEGCLIVRVV